MNQEHQLMADRLRFCGALLFFLSLLSGWFILGAVRGHYPGDAEVVGQAHVTGFLGCLWLLAIAHTLPNLKLGDTSLFLLYRFSIMAAFGKWVLTMVRSSVGGEGTLLTGETGNDAVFVLNQILVVIPGFICAVLWVRGLADAARNPTASTDETSSGEG